MSVYDVYSKYSSSTWPPELEVPWPKPPVRVGEFLGFTAKGYVAVCTPVTGEVKQFNSADVLIFNRDDHFSPHNWSSGDHYAKHLREKARVEAERSLEPNEGVS